MTSGRRNRALCALLLMLLVLTGCGQKTPPALPDVYAALESAASLPPMTMLDADELSDYIGIDDTLCSSVQAHAAQDGLVVDAVMLFTARDEKSAQSIEAQLSDYLDYRKREMRDYLPEQYAVLERAVLRRDGVQVALLISPQVDALVQAYEKAIR